MELKELLKLGLARYGHLRIHYMELKAVAELQFIVDGETNPLHGVERRLHRL